MPDNFQIVSDSVYRGGYPSVKDIQLLHDVYGIKRFISLDGNIAKNIKPFLDMYNIQQVVVPLMGSETKMTDNISYLMNNIDKLINQVKPVYVHCKLGKDRTGLAIALYRIKSGWSSDAAFSEAKKYGFGSGISADAQNFYKKVIFGYAKDAGGKDINEVDDGTIIDEMRDTFLLGDTQPNFCASTGAVNIPDPDAYDKVSNIDALTEIYNSIPLVGQDSESIGAGMAGGDIGYSRYY